MKLVGGRGKNIQKKKIISRGGGKISSKKQKWD
jgi:hypothetical protein